MDGYTTLTLLLARLLITDPDCWTSGVLARDEDGRPVSPLDEAATSWCPRGAVYRVVGGDIQAYRRASRALERSARMLYGAKLRAVNDSASPFAHQSILGAFDHAVDAVALARRALTLAGRPLSPGTDVLGLREPDRGGAEARPLRRREEVSRQTEPRQHPTRRGGHRGY
jgi:hypothetical protein